MADRPIIFSGPMIRALLAGRKTQTRRVLSREGLRFNGGAWPKGLDLADMDLAAAWVDGGPSPAGNPGPYLKADWPYGRLIEGDARDDAEWLMARLYPKLQRGDQLWIRESFRVNYGADWYRDDLGRAPKPKEMSPEAIAVEYLCDGERELGGKSYPSSHMPRWASRLTLIVEDVRFQRLQEISEADAAAEGIERPGIGAPFWKSYRPDPAMPVLDPVESYAGLWDSLHAKPGKRWDDNPWIVALTFRVIHENIDRIPA